MNRITLILLITFLLSLAHLVGYAQSDPVKLNFGYSYIPDVDGWNKIYNHESGNSFPDLEDVNGNNSGLTATITSHFANPGSAGMTSSPLYDDDVIQNYFYVYNDIVGQVTVSGLTAEYYTIIIMPSSNKYTPRTGEYTVNNDPSSLETQEASRNTLEEVIYTSVSPISGSISIEVKVHTSDGSSTNAYLNSIVIIPQGGGPTLAPPANFNVTATTTSSITVNWDAVDGATDYLLQSSLSSTFTSPTDASTTSTSYTFTGLAASTQYYIRVRATDGTNYSLYASTNGTTDAAAPTCSDGIQNGDETGIDCGGSCPDCVPGGGDSFWNQGTGSSIYYDGNVGIGTTTDLSNRLTVDGTIKAERIDVVSSITLNGMIDAGQIRLNTTIPQSDHVFNTDYKLMSLSELDAYIKTHKHLPEIPSAKEFKENGYSVGEMDDLLLRKIEELTLYILELETRLKELESE